jgi:hypothetical protein
MLHLVVGTDLGLAQGLLVASFAAVLGTLLLWLAGHRLTYRGDDRRRLREGDLDALADFYRLYGECFARRAPFSWSAPPLNRSSARWAPNSSPTFSSRGSKRGIPVI